MGEQLMLPIVGCDCVGDECVGEVVEVFIYAVDYNWGFGHYCEFHLKQEQKKAPNLYTSVVEGPEDKAAIKRANLM